MAIAATIEWEMRSAGNADNGGGFKTGASGTDHTQQDTAFATRTDLVIGSAGSEDELASAADNFAADDVGNLIHVTAGSGFTVGFYEVLSVTAGVATVDRNVGTADSTAGTGQLGGAVFATDAVFEAAEPGNKFHLKADATYTIAAINVAKDGTTTSPIIVEGYNATRGDVPREANRPLIAAAGNTFSFDNFWHIENIRVTTTAAAGLRGDTGTLFKNCSSYNSSGTVNRDAFNIGGLNSKIIDCEGRSDDGAGTGNGPAVATLNAGLHVIECYLHDSDIGIEAGAANSTAVIRNLFDTMVTAGIKQVSANNGIVYGNTFYNCEKALEETDGELWTVRSNIFDNGTDGVDWQTTEQGSNIFDWNNYSNNTTDRTNVPVGDNDTALSPGFADAANGDFAVGTNMKGTGAEALFPGGLTEQFLDQGAAQREEPAGGGGGGVRNPVRGPVG